MTQKRRTGKYPFSGGRNSGRTTGEVNAGSVGDDELVNIVEVKEQAQDFFEKNQKLILGILTAIVLAIGGYMIWKYLILEPKEKAAIEAIRQAQTQFDRDSFALALENPGGGFEGFLDIIDNYSGTATANTAKFYAGISYLNLGKFESAIEYLQDYSPKDNITPAMKEGALGDAYAELQDYEKALSQYNKAADKADNEFITPYYLKKVALLHYKNGNMEESKNAFTQIAKNYPNSAEAQDAEKYLARLN